MGIRRVGSSLARTIRCRSRGGGGTGRHHPSRRAEMMMSATSRSSKGLKKEMVKICVICNRPFNWRKKWERCWDEVRTCSKRCNAERRRVARRANKRTHQQKQPQHLATADDRDIYQETGTFAQIDDGISMDIGEKDSISADTPTSMLSREERKKRCKTLKAERRRNREGRGDSSKGQKACTVCGKCSFDVLIRCRIDSAGEWHFACGKCWREVSGGVPDGDVDHPFYQYGGLWRNRHIRDTHPQHGLRGVWQERGAFEAGT